MEITAAFAKRLLQQAACAKGEKSASSLRISDVATDRMGKGKKAGYPRLCS